MLLLEGGAEIKGKDFFREDVEKAMGQVAGVGRPPPRPGLEQPRYGPGRRWRRTGISRSTDGIPAGGLERRRLARNRRWAV